MAEVGVPWIFGTVAGRQGRGKTELRSGLNFCGAKNKLSARRVSYKPLICFVPEPGIEPGRRYERGGLRPSL